MQETRRKERRTDGREERAEECGATEQKPGRSVVALLSLMSPGVPFKFSDADFLSGNRFP